MSGGQRFMSVGRKKEEDAAGLRKEKRETDEVKNNLPRLEAYNLHNDNVQPSRQSEEIPQPCPRDNPV